MEINAFREDFHFLYTALLQHPSILIDARLKTDFTGLYESKADKVHSYDSLINAATELTVFFQDGHTNIEVPYSAEDLCIPLPCKWDEHGSLVLDEEGYGEIPPNVQIIEINGKTVEELISLMSEKIPHENRYLVKSRMIKYPYQNYHLFSERSLNYLFGEREGYDISFLINGSTLKKRCFIRKYNGFLDFADDSDFIAYEI